MAKDKIFILPTYWMNSATSSTITLPFVKMNGAYTKSNSISPETMQIYHVNDSILDLSLWFCPIQPYIVKIHLARTARYRHVASGPQANSHHVNVGQIDALIGKG